MKLAALPAEFKQVVAAWMGANPLQPSPLAPDGLGSLPAYLSRRFSWQHNSDMIYHEPPNLEGLRAAAHRIASICEDRNTWYAQVVCAFAGDIHLFPDRGPELRAAFHEISAAARTYDSGGLTVYPHDDNDAHLDAAIRDAAKRAGQGEAIRRTASLLYTFGDNENESPAPAPAGNPAPSLDMSQQAWGYVCTLPMPARDVQVPGMIYGGEIGVIYGPGGVSKTSFAIVIALSIVTGRDLLGLGRIKQGKVLFVIGEDGIGEVRMRFTAAMWHYGISDADLIGRLWVVGCESADELVVTCMGAGGREVFRAEGVSYLAEMLRQTGATAAFIDPLISFAGEGLNDNGLMSKVMTAWKAAIAPAGASLTILAHPKKGTSSAAHGADANAGAGAIVNRARGAFGIDPVSDTEALKMGADPSNSRGIKCVKHTKANLSRKLDDIYIEVVGVRLNNGPPDNPEGDSVPVATRFIPQAGGGTWCTDAMRQGILFAVANGTPAGERMSMKSGASSPRYFGNFLPAALAANFPGASPVELNMRVKEIVRDLIIRGWLREVKSVVARPGKGRISQAGMEVVWTATPWASDPVPGPHCS